MSSICEATPIILTSEERTALDSLIRCTKTEYRLRFKARIVLMAADGAATRAIAREVGCTIGTASKWRVRYATDRLAGFSETGNRGPEPKYGPETALRILALLDERPPAGYANWTAVLIARALGDVHEQYIWRFLRAQKINLSGRKSWCESNDPDFVAKAAEIVGLSMAPPENAIVLAVDEKPSIQALERTKAISSCRTDARSPASRTTISGTERPRCSPPSTSPPARSSAVIPGVAAASNSSPS